MTGTGPRREWRMRAFTVPGAVTGGNPAGVVLDPPELSPEAMTRIAVRLNPLSETAFVRPPEGAGDPARGDAAIVWMDMPVARRVGVALDIGAVADALGLPVEVMASRPAAAVEDVGIRVALLPVADLAALDAMRPDFDRLEALGRDDRIIVFYPFVLDEPAGRVKARAFAPAVAIDEDPATGTAAASLGAYLARERLIEPDVELRVRQGEAMGHPSEIRLRVRHDDGRPRSIRVGGLVRRDAAEGS
ncbi:MAG: PhzF family phenazine biosynthesis protein [Gemmatimonadota bacterium]